MKSSFNLEKQNQQVESRIVVALERISEAFRVLLWQESKVHSLSPIQIQLLIFISFHQQEKCKVSYLADEFNMTKATISDSVRVLLSKKLVEKETDPNDTRSYTLSLTDAGKTIVKKSATFASPIEKPIESLTEGQKEVMLSSLLKLIHDLNKADIINVQRMCFNCVNYQKNDDIHFCKLIKKQLAESELRLDCPEHQKAS